MTTTVGAVGALAGAAHPVTGAADDYDALLDLVGDRRFVLIGEASHGTHEFYRERARITRRLIDELGFTAVAVEADWPDAYRVNRYVMGLSRDLDANTALSDFRRFPAWMWRNQDVLQFVEWLRARNDAHAHPATKAGFYGLDLYSLQASIEAVIEYLDRVDPAEARPGPRPLQLLRPRRARRARPTATRSRTSARFPARTRSSRSSSRCAAGPTPTSAATAGSPRTSCSSRSRTRASCATPRSTTSRCTAPRCRRGTSATGTWPARSTRSPTTSTRSCGRAKIVVWEHNSHVGDARATAMGGTRRAERRPARPPALRRTTACSSGFTTYDGRVTAASELGRRRRAQARTARAPRQPRGAAPRGRASPHFWLATADARRPRRAARHRGSSARSA